ncbi:MAG: 4Fe-4S dicluster domain-containing protein [Deltaproteobacteria bacterium]|nr:4Fe-4S dicluster domain-containing protein [Deltaproteobacteria bacterium]
MSDAEKSGFNRRTFFKALGAVGIAATAGGAFLLPGNLLVIPHSEGYLVVDMGKCMGCCTCMTTCSLTHHGKVSLSLSRIQIQQNSFANWPEDISMSICRQCKDAPCVAACPVEANHVDTEHGMVRRIDADRCIGCMQCIAACPYIPKRLQWDPVHRKAQKCDLCVDTPFLKDKGGPGNTQACVKVCPVGAIAFVAKMPDQEAPHGYEVNLRGKGWEKSGGTREDLYPKG